EANGLEWLKPNAKDSGLIVGGISAMTWKRQFNLIRVATGLIPDPKAEAKVATRIRLNWRFHVIAEMPPTMRPESLAFGFNHSSPFASILAQRRRRVFVVSFKISILPSSNRIRLQSNRMA